MQQEVRIRSDESTEKFWRRVINGRAVKWYRRGMNSNNLKLREEIKMRLIYANMDELTNMDDLT